MKLRSQSVWASLVFALSLATVQAVPTYHITETNAGLETDIPGASISPETSKAWRVTLPAGEAWAFYSRFFLDEPAFPGEVNEITMSSNGTSLVWVTRLLEQPFDHPHSSPYLFLSGIVQTSPSSPFANVIFADMTTPVPESASTEGLLLVGLAAVGVYARNLQRRAAA